MTTAGFMSGPRAASTPSLCSRVASVLSFLLGVLLVVVLPALLDAAPYLGLLAGALALVVLLAGAVLWAVDTIVVRAGIVVGAVATLFGAVLAAYRGLPGAGDLSGLTPFEGAAALTLALAVLVLLLADALHRPPVETPDRPYAL